MRIEQRPSQIHHDTVIKTQLSGEAPQSLILNLEKKNIMLRKEVQSQTKNDILKALLRRSRFPDLLKKQQNVRSQSLHSLNLKHELNLQSRRKANDAHRLSQHQSLFKRIQHEEELKKQQKQLQARSKEKQKQLNLIRKSQEMRMADVKSRIKQMNKEKRKVMMDEHQVLLKKLENAQTYKVSITLPHYRSESYESSQRLKEKRGNQEVEYAKKVHDSSFQRLEESRLRLLKKEEERKASIGKIDRRLAEAREKAEEKEQQRYKSAIQKCVKSFQGSEKRVKEHLKERMAWIDNKVRNDQEKHKKVLLSCKSQFIVNSKGAKQDLEITVSKISKAEEQRDKMRAIHLQNHKQKRQHESKIIRTSFRENQQFVKNKVALQQKTLNKQILLSKFKQQFEKTRQAAISDHFANRNIVSQHLSSTPLPR